MNIHEQAQQWILLEQSGELDADTRARLNQHVKDCNDCRAFKADLRALEAAWPPVPEKPLPELTLQAIRQEAHTVKEKTGKHILQFPQILRRAAAAVLLLGATGWILFQSVQPGPATSTLARQSDTALSPAVTWDASLDGDIDTFEQELTSLNSYEWIISGDDTTLDVNEIALQLLILEGEQT